MEYEEIVAYDSESEHDDIALDHPSPASVKPKKQEGGRKLTKRVSEAQQKALIKFMTAHPELRKGKFSATFTQKMAKVLWQKATIKLNAIPGGANKDALQWRRCWHDIKKVIRAKAAAEQKHQGRKKKNEMAVSELLREEEMKENPCIKEERLAMEDPLNEDFENPESPREDEEINSSTSKVFYSTVEIHPEEKKANENIKENILQMAQDQVKATEKTNEILSRIADEMKLHNEQMKMLIEILLKK
ncbi:uncharacterized protein LOC129801981 [Phlebotomus papatasi]|uniref:uncharacterized protein LOC129801981 n=1 Tax=Phlebotomus papatasi TaxID=29031 RepID=UPI0024835489|nr:uncharacterized protein LOC129801981 [Phlebotomus papatasi]XP_055703481.1 uncharacterized protein LOC129801981 [Phlebotomus papatasi]XP_055703482.1 uncharacterized protein LOC129801981 [Phlebotomus papatasi]